jgi:hypothetical protein
LSIFADFRELIWFRRNHLFQKIAVWDNTVTHVNVVMASASGANRPAVYVVSIRDIPVANLGQKIYDRVQTVGFIGTSEWSDAQGTIIEQMPVPVRYGAPAGACNAFNREFFGGDSISIASGLTQMVTGLSVSSTSLQTLRDGTCFTMCAEGTYEISLPLSCVSCPESSTSAANSQSISDCKCQVGFTGDPASACTSCPTGKYKDTTGSEECKDCPAYSSSQPGSNALADCQCEAGYSGPDGGACLACVAGKFKASSGPAACTDCPVNSISFSTNCQCEAGYSGPDGGACLACEAGKFKASSGPAACADCPVNSISFSTNCQCEAGYSGPDGGACSACAAGSYKNTTGSAACTFCGVGFHSNATAAPSAAACVACPSDSYSVEGSDRIDQCYCNPGYRQTPSHDACSECNPGYYDSITDRYECSKCAGGLYSAAVAATGVETCKPCEAGTWSEEGSPTCQVCPAYSNSTRGSALLTNCTCNPGASGSNGATCVLCSSTVMYNKAVGQESAQKFMKQTGDLKAATIYFAS